MPHPPSPPHTAPRASLASVPLALMRPRRALPATRQDPQARSKVGLSGTATLSQGWRPRRSRLLSRTAGRELALAAPVLCATRTRMSSTGGFGERCHVSQAGFSLGCEKWPRCGLSLISCSSRSMSMAARSSSRLMSILKVESAASFILRCCLYCWKSAADQPTPDFGVVDGSATSFFAPARARSKHGERQSARPAMRAHVG